MAKKEKQTEPAEKTMPVRPDPNKETILLRYPLDGSVKVVSALKDEKGSPSLIWVEPSGKNQPRFYECNNCREVANFFDLEYRRAFAENRDRKTIPELYKVPFDKVGLIGEELRKLSDDPQNAVILETVKKYRTYTAQLNRITFDIARMPIAELAAEGFDIEQMKKDGAFKLLEVGRQTKLYPVKAVQTGHITKESTYSLHCFFDQNGEIGFKAQSALSEPEYRTDERLRRELTKQDINDLRAKKTLNRLMQHDGEYCFVGFNKDTQRMIYVPCKDVRIPDYIFGQFIGPSRKQEFERGGSVLLENCNYAGNDNHFSGHAHFDVHRRDYVVDDPHYERPYLPEHIRTQMPKEEVDKYFAGEVMKGYRYKGRDGRPFTQDFRLNTETNACEFIDYQKQAASLQQTQTQGPISDPPESMEPQEAPYMAPHIPEEGQDRSQGPRM